MFQFNHRRKLAHGRTSFTKTDLGFFYDEIDFFPCINSCYAYQSQLLGIFRQTRMYLGGAHCNSASESHKCTTLYVLCLLTKTAFLGRQQCLTNSMKNSPIFETHCLQSYFLEVLHQGTTFIKT